MSDKKTLKFDPKSAQSPNMYRYSVLYTLASGEFRATRTAELVSNLAGAEVLVYGIGKLFEGLDALDGVRYVDLKNGKEELRVMDDEELIEDWLKTLIVGAGIVDVIPVEGT